MPNGRMLQRKNEATHTGSKRRSQAIPWTLHLIQFLNKAPAPFPF
jgi:hypothetical protein